MNQTKAELQIRLNWLKEQVAEYESKLAEPEKVGRWKPDEYGIYFTLNEGGAVHERQNSNPILTESSHKFGNVYKAAQQAESARDQQLTRVKVLDRIVELNQGFEFDWTDPKQTKHAVCICYSGRFLDMPISSFIESTLKRHLHKSKYLKSHQAAQTLIDEFTPEELATVYQ